MKPYRGKRIDNGGLVYGNLITHISEAGEGLFHSFIEEIPSYWNTDEAGNHFWEHRKWKVSPETVRQFVCKDKNNKDVWAGDEVIEGLSKFTAIAGFKSWVWLYKLNDPTYHWKIVRQGDIELIERPK